jgi:hypothetical protein
MEAREEFPHHFPLKTQLCTLKCGLARYLAVRKVSRGHNFYKDFLLKFHNI